MLSFWQEKNWREEIESYGLPPLRERERERERGIYIFNTTCDMVGSIIALQGYFWLMS